MRIVLLIFFIISLLVATPNFVYSKEKAKQMPLTPLDAKQRLTGLAAYDKAWTEIMREGKLYLEAGLYDEATDYFEDVVLKYPTSPSAHYYLGLSYYGNEYLESAEESFNKAKELDPHYPDAYYSLALVEHKKGNAKEVIKYLDEVTLLDNTFQKAYYNKGITYLSLGEPKRAVKELAYAMHLRPTDFPTLIGFLEACARLDLIEIDKSGPQRSDEVKFVVRGPTITPAQGLDESAASITKEKAMQIFLVAPEGKKEIIITRENPVELKSKEYMEEAIELDFPDAKDLKDKTIKLQIKGKRGDEEVKVVVRDSDGNRSPAFYISWITERWNIFSIDIEDKAGGLIDPSRIKHIRFELLPPTGSEGSENSTITIKQIEIE